MAQSITADEFNDRITAALEVAADYGGIDGDHHKMWVIDQMVRALTGPGYEAWVKVYEGPDEEGETYDWDCGIAP
jgi:hypothetical protein